MKHVSFDSNGAQIMVAGKTGMRRVRIIASAPLLTQWLENHPRKEDPREDYRRSSKFNTSRVNPGEPNDSDES